MEKNGLEIERKFLIKRLAAPIEGERRLDIVQTYLRRGDPAIQRRVRKITENGSDTYFYTEKKFISPGIREEKEQEIAAGQYEKLLSEADNELTPIIKTRRIFNCDGQNFEMDEYPFSQTLATIELELADVGNEIRFPDFIDIIKEVTSDSRYSNAAMAKAGEFPEKFPED